MLKFFAEKMWVAFHIFSAKNIRILYIESAKTVNEMTLNELVKLTTLVSVLSIVSFFFHDFNLNTQGFINLEFANCQLGLHRNVKCNVRMYIYYTIVLYTDMSRLSSYIEINRTSFRY